MALEIDSSILLIYTGGTIGMVMDPKSGSLKPFSLENLLRTVPELEKINFQIHSTTFTEPIDSSNVTPALWQDLCSIIEENYSKYDGFVILHGTDTMAFSASALSFMLSGLNKPVIFTGSQLPIGMIRTDGKENLLSALEIAADKKPNGEPRIPEVGLYFDSYLFRGNRSHKSSTQNFDAFVSHNFPPLAKAGVDIKYRTNRILSIERKPFKVYRELNNNVLVATLFPGQPLHLLSEALKHPDLKGVILRSFGAGNAPNNPDFLNLIDKIVDRNVVVLNVTQCNHGTVDQMKYETGSTLAQARVIGGKDITLEAALTKMMVSLGNFSHEEVLLNLNKSLRGEITEFEQ
jgi:L-asparaginase